MEEEQVVKVQSTQDKEKPGLGEQDDIPVIDEIENPSGPEAEYPKDKPDNPGDQEEEIIEIPNFPGEDKEIEYELTYFVNDSSIKDVEVLMEYGKRGEVKNEYVYGLQRVTKSEEGKESQYIYNGRGSVVKELQDKKEVATYQYGDYGELIKGKPKQDSVYGYNGENYNSVTELTYLRARYYDPKIGRFIQIDRNYEGENDDSLSQNRYAYTLNNPYKYVDKDGNKNTYNPNGFGYENVTSAYSDRGADFIIKKYKNKSLKEFEKKIKGFTKTQKARAMKAWNDAHPSAKNKKAEVYGPPVPPGWTAPNKPKNNSTNSNANSTGGVTKPTQTTPKPITEKELTNIIARCPEKYEPATAKNMIIMSKEFATAAIEAAQGEADKASASSIIERAIKSMSKLDEIFEKFQKDKKYDTDKENSEKRTTYIKVDNFFNAITDFNVDLVKEYLKAKSPGFVEMNLAFMNLVGSYKPWDFKNRPGKSKTRPWNDSFIFKGQYPAPSDFYGNFHYGYIGAVLFEDEYKGNEDGVRKYLIMAAGAAQLISDAPNWNWDNYNGVGDNKGDSKQILQGINSYFNWGRRG